METKIEKAKERTFTPSNDELHIHLHSENDKYEAEFTQDEYGYWGGSIEIHDNDESLFTDSAVQEYNDFKHEYDVLWEQLNKNLPRFYVEVCLHPDDTLLLDSEHTRICRLRDWLLSCERAVADGIEEKITKQLHIDTNGAPNESVIIDAFIREHHFVRPNYTISKHGEKYDVTVSQQFYEANKVLDYIDEIYDEFVHDGVQDAEILNGLQEAEILNETVEKRKHRPEDVLSEPFLSAFGVHDAQIDYRSYHCADHEYVKEKLGIVPKVQSDCSCSTNKLPGFSLSSWGDWGTVYFSDVTEEGKEIFLDMVARGVVKPWRIMYYKKCGDEYTAYSYDCVWTKYDEARQEYVACENPFETDEK